MRNISRKSKKKLIQKMKATYHEIQLIKIMYTEEALPRYKVPTKLYYRNDGRDKYPHIAMFFGKRTIREMELDDRFSTKCNPEFLEKHLVVEPLDIVHIKCLQCGDTHRVPKEVWNNAPHLHDSYMKLSYCPICKKTVAHGIVEEMKSDE